MGSTSRTTLWAFLLITGIIVLSCVLLWYDDGDKSHVEDYLNVEILDMLVAESPLLIFGPEDVEVAHGWSIFSGIYPAVKFRCRFDSPHKESGSVILCYRPQGSAKWLMADTRLRRENTARLTLRDLRRDTPYECFFILVGDGCLSRSAVVVFNTANT
jgi:hypothetical protein